MAADSPRILELRRRVQADPASIAFAQLAEECRRAGAADDAIGICRAGLAHHPGYLSARVTLGRALIEVGRLDEAAIEMSTVVQSAPTNLPAIRGLAEIHQQKGDMPQALTFYQRALQLAQFDPDLEDSVERLSQVVSAVPAPSAPAPAKVEELFNFDSLLMQLGGTATNTPAFPDASASAAEGRYGETSPKLASLDVASVGGPSLIDSVDLSLHQDDVFAGVERELRERAEHRAAEEKSARIDLANRRQSAVVAELEEWLSAIAVDRRAHDRA